MQRRITVALFVIFVLAGLWQIAAAQPTIKKHSNRFIYRYEARQAGPVEEQAGWWRVYRQSDPPDIIPQYVRGGISRVRFEPLHSWILTDSLENLLDNGTGWTFEARLRVIEQTQPRGAVALTVDDRNGYSGGANGLQIHMDKTQFTFDQKIVDQSRNDDDFHTFRLAEEPSSDFVHAWRDGVYLGKSREFQDLSAPLEKCLLIGSWSRALSGKIDIDYLRWDFSGGFAPDSLLEISETDGRTSVAEEGAGSDTYTIRLLQKPESAVRVKISAAVGMQDSLNVDLGAGPGQPLELSFDPSNWDREQIVTLQAVDDTLREGLHSIFLRHQLISQDILFDGADELLAVEIIDNEVPVYVLETGDGTLLREADQKLDSLLIMVSKPPRSPVTISLQADNGQVLFDDGSASIELVFTAENWMQARTVRFRAMDDAEMDRLRFWPLHFSVSSADESFSNYKIDDVFVRIIDDDPAHTRREDFSLPLVNLDQDSRQVVVDRRPGVYLGHPTTVLLADSQTILTTYPVGHGKGPIQYKKSFDGGLSWTDTLPTPASWKTSKEVPTLFRMSDPAGKERIILFSGLYPARRAWSEDNGQTWSELEPVGDWGGIVVMGCAIRLKDGRYMAMFHDDGRFFHENGYDNGLFTVYKTYTADGGLTWSYPEAIIECDWADPCEPGIFRSPDGGQLLVLLRENSRKYNSFFITSNDEGETWSALKELPGALTGDRHTGKQLPDGRLFISFRDQGLDSPTWGDWVGWIGTYDDIINGREGQYRLLIKDNTRDADCAYPGVELLADSTIVTTTYGHWIEGQQPYIVSARFKASEVDRLVGIDSRKDRSPGSYRLYQNYPNPFNPNSTIRYSLKDSGHTSLNVYDVQGRIVRTLVDDFRERGNHRVVWDGKDQWGKPVSSGIYVYRLRANGFKDYKKMALIR